MQKIFFLVIILFGQILIARSQSKYQIKSCKIDIVFSNGFSKGTKTLIFNDWGRIEKETDIVYLDTTNEFVKQTNANRTIIRSLIINKRDSIISIDLDKMMGSQSRKFFIEMSSYVDSLKKNKIGETMFLGKHCDIVDFQGIKIYYWKGIVLKKEFSKTVNNRVYEYATSIDENYVIQENEFKIPDGVMMK